MYAIKCKFSDRFIVEISKVLANVSEISQKYMINLFKLQKMVL